MELDFALEISMFYYLVNEMPFSSSTVKFFFVSSVTYYVNVGRSVY